MDGFELKLPLLDQPWYDFAYLHHQPLVDLKIQIKDTNKVNKYFAIEMPKTNYIRNLCLIPVIGLADKVLRIVPACAVGARGAALNGPCIAAKPELPVCALGRT